jgi:hypothetical protein
MRFIGVFLVSLLLASSANANDTKIKAFLARTYTDRGNLGMLGWTVYNMDTVNAYLDVREHRPPVFCRPENLNVSSEDARTILAKYLDKHSDRAEDTMDIYSADMLDALIENFPCDETGKPR